MSVHDVMSVSYQTCVAAAEARQTPDLLRACSELLSGHYGVRGESAPRIGARPGARVAMRPGRLKDTCLFDEETCSVVVAQEAGRLIGHAFICTFPFSRDSAPEGTVVWITQLVVHREYRHRGIATELYCRRALENKQAPGANPPVTHFGLVSSHPYAVRSIEKASDDKVSDLEKRGSGNSTGSGKRDTICSRKTS